MINDTQLLRQVHPAWIQDGRITSQVFKPTPKDEQKLSVYDGDLITPEKSWQYFTKELKLESKGVLAVTVSECANQNLSVESDPNPHLAHAIIRYDGHTESKIRKIAQYLKRDAENRGWLFQEYNQ